MTVSAIQPNRAKVPRYLQPQPTSFFASVVSPFSGDYTPIILVGSLTSFFLFSYLYDVDSITFVVAVSILLTAAIVIVLFRLFHAMLTTDPYEQVADDFPPEEITISPWALFESDGGSVAELYRHYKHRAYTSRMMFQHVMGAFNTPAETEQQTVAVLSDIDSSTRDSDIEDPSDSETEGCVLTQRGSTKKSPNQVKTRKISSEVTLPLLTGRYSWKQVVKSLNKCESSYEHLNASAKVIYFFIPPSKPSPVSTPASTLLNNTIQHGMPLEVLILPPSHSVVSSAKSFFSAQWSNLCLLALEHVDRARGIHGVQTVATEGMMNDDPEKYQKFSEMQNPGVFSGTTLDPYDNDIECISRDFPEILTSLLDHAHPDSQHSVYQSPAERTVPLYGNLTARQISAMCGDDDQNGKGDSTMPKNTNTDLDTATIRTSKKQRSTNTPVTSNAVHGREIGEEGREEDEGEDEEDEDDEEVLGSNTVLRNAYTRLRETTRATTNEQRFLASTPHCTLAHRLLALIWLLDARHIGIVCSREQMIDMCLALGIQKRDMVIEDKEQKDWRACAVLGMRMHQ